MRWKNFSEWKAYTTAFLIHLKNKYKDDQKAINDLNTLLTKLHYLRGRDLSNWLLWCHIVMRDTGVRELIEIIPTQNEILNLISD